MSQEMPSTSAEPATGARENHPILIPPEESVWRRYSSNHEFPLSTLASVVLHLFVAMAVLLFGAAIFHWGSSQPELPQIDNIQYGERTGEKGGGGHPDAGNSPDLMAERDNSKDDFDRIDPNKLPDRSFLDPDNREERPDATKEVGPLGKFGEGSGGGGGKGRGRWFGNGVGDGRPDMRTDRWAIAMRYSTGEELYREWANLQAIILVPEGRTAQGQPQYRVYYDLTTKAPKGKLETTETLQSQGRLWFTDSSKDSVRQLSQYLGYSTPPRFMAFFIPKALEAELLQKELAYAKKKNEAEMAGWETTFEVRRSGNKFVATVTEQKRKANLKK